jgi:hypothetical protein
LLTVGCRQFPGIVKAGTLFPLSKKSSNSLWKASAYQGNAYLTDDLSGNCPSTLPMGDQSNRQTEKGVSVERHCCGVGWALSCGLANGVSAGGHGIINLQFMGVALQVRWMWLNKVEPNKPGAGMPTIKNSWMEALFEASVLVEVNDGRQCCSGGTGGSRGSQLSISLRI